MPHPERATDAAAGPLLAEAQDEPILPQLAMSIPLPLLTFLGLIGVVGLSTVVLVAVGGALLALFPSREPVVMVIAMPAVFTTVGWCHYVALQRVRDDERSRKQTGAWLVLLAFAAVGTLLMTAIALAVFFYLFSI